MKKLIGLTACIVLLGMAGLAQASLTHIGWAAYDDGNPNIGAYKLIYDDDLQLTWLDYTNSADTFQNQRDWAVSLNDPDVLEYYFFSGITVNWAEEEYWRLPGGYEPVESTHLYFDELGFDSHEARGGIPFTAEELNASEFDNFAAGIYWIDPPLPWIPILDGIFFAYVFDLGGIHSPPFEWDGGVHGMDYNLTPYYGIAVRSGQLSIVPVPGAILFLGSGLAGLFVFRKKFHKG